jgi:voltage-gated potassium channel
LWQGGQSVDIERLSGLHYARTARHRRDADNAAHPIVVILAVTALLVLAYAGLYRALTLADPKAFTVQAPLDGISAIYFSAVTMATVGFGDISPVSDPARIAVVSQIGIGITAFSLFISTLVNR